LNTSQPTGRLNLHIQIDTPEKSGLTPPLTTNDSTTDGEMIGKILAEGSGDFLHRAIKTVLERVVAVEVDRLVIDAD
jgi:hypothetical protein